MRVTGATFLKWMNWILETVKDREGKEHRMCIAPTQVCAMQYISDEQYRPADTVLGPAPVRQTQKNCVNLYQTQSPDSILDLKCFHVLASRSKRNID